MSYAPRDTLSLRHTHLRHAMREQGLDALIVTAPSNILYLTNFRGSAAIAVLSPDRLHLLTDFRYSAAIEDTRGTPIECPDLDLVRVDAAYDAALASLLADLPAARVGFDAAHVTVGRHRWLLDRLAVAPRAPELVATEGLVEWARARKDPHELATLRRGAHLLSEVASTVFTEIHSGRTERDIALAIEFRMRGAGFERAAFETIVASGPNAALPHARPSERTLREGDLVVLDFGGVYASYCVDLTRTVAVGSASARARHVHAAVLRAHDRAIAAVGVGQSRFAVDAAARAALDEVGMGEAFGHGTGHGLGLDIHEDPRIVRRRPDTDARDEGLAPGMVFTIEPGAYFPGWGGVRIEDDVALHDEGVEQLTRVTTELLEL